MIRAAIVVPTIGRPSLRVLLDSLARTIREPFEELIIVDDRPPSVSRGSAMTRTGGKRVRTASAVPSLDALSATTISAISGN